MENLHYWLSGTLFIFAAIVLAMALYSYRRKEISAAKAFSFLCLATFFYFFGNAMELVSTELSEMLFWNLVQSVNTFIPFFWLLLALQYCGKEKAFPPFYIKLFFSLALLLLLGRFTNPLHHLFYHHVYMEYNGYFHVFKAHNGPLFYLKFIYTTIAFLLSNHLFYQLSRESKGSVKKLGQLMFVASLLPYLAYAMFIYVGAPYGIDLVPLALVISYFFFMLAIFKFQFFDLIPLAYHKVFESIKDAVIVLDKEQKILDYNPAAKAFFQKLDKKAIGQNLDELFQDQVELVKAVDKGVDSTITFQVKDRPHYYDLKLSALTNQKGEEIGRIIVLSDITKQVAVTEEFKWMASHDELTGIYNRRVFFEYGNHELERLKRNKLPLSLIMFDIDHFKRVNDTYGHQAGDVVLQKVAEVVKKNIRACDLFARFGGEEFVILLADVTPQKTMAVAEKLRVALEAMEVTTEGVLIKVTSSFGVSGVEAVGQESLDVLIAQADQALYEAKARGRNRVESAMMISCRKN
ncbi:diguanylate cyclase [Heliorestis acidaminivorans]|uniref:Diguanylate cyclase n=1 Tax=Heliorestis acidaminivorans TaxID=553427 RepID=A0A6I0EWW8_9FIRM|nr:diguanylate cyclase [Heliorestis acidaminivorans]KAB2951633.1 diguanylate cyclase [Heliorestis acidaminivorans]